VPPGVGYLTPEKAPSDGTATLENSYHRLSTTGGR
jgi:hypothetical protein